MAGRRAATAVFAVLVLLFGLRLLTRALNGGFDHDEGAYTYVAWLVGQGERPYVDFFHQQMPLMPYVYAVGLKAFGSSLAAARLVSVLLGTVFFGAFLYVVQQRVHEAPGFRWAAVVAGVVLLSDSLLARSFAEASMQALPNCLAMLSFALLTPWSRGKPLRLPLIGISGVLGGAVVATRANLAPVLVPLWCLAVVAAQGGARRRAAAALVFAGGVLIGLAPALYFFARDPQVFLFGNLGWHVHTNAMAVPPDSPGTKLRTLQQYMLATPKVLALLLALAWVAERVLRRRAGERTTAEHAVELAALGMVAAFAAGSLSAPILWPRFLDQLMPYLLIAGAAWLAAANDQAPESGLRSRAALSLAVLLVALCSPGVLTFPLTAVRMLSARHTPALQLRQEGDALRTLSGPEEPVLASWPGYLAEAGRIAPAGTEYGIFTRRSAHLLSDQEAARYKIAKPKQTLGLIRGRRVRVIVLGMDTPADWEQALRGGYELRWTDGEVRIYTLRGQT